MTLSGQLNKVVREALQSTSKKKLAELSGVDRAVIIRLLSTDPAQRRLPSLHAADKLYCRCQQIVASRDAERQLPGPGPNGVGL
ncbi:hypothetical protein V5E97_17450 [Singulisphaera sp. Ch08]|uniref:XRE family transcriptional regulator n=1 Tax=Singulisphaera sp. Ch08 TaxID=3120278 RepID=A0AAU7CRB2_9BACT